MNRYVCNCGNEFDSKNKVTSVCPACGEQARRYRQMCLKCNEVEVIRERRGGLCDNCNSNSGEHKYKCRVCDNEFRSRNSSNSKCPDCGNVAYTHIIKCANCSEIFHTSSYLIDTCKKCSNSMNVKPVSYYLENKELFGIDKQDLKHLKEVLKDFNISDEIKMHTNWRIVILCGHHFYTSPELIPDILKCKTYEDAYKSTLIATETHRSSSLDGFNNW